MFTIHWKQSALNELAALWTEADPSERKAITESANRIDRILSNDPEAQGESRPDGRRIVFFAPIGILIRIHNSANVVDILQVWHY